jgi:hypothetical protein
VEKVKPRPPNYLLLAPILDFAALGLNVMSNTGTDWMIALGVEGFAGLVGLISWAMARKFKSSKVVTGLHILSELGVFYLIRKAEKSARNTKNGATIVSFFNAGMSLMLSLHFNHEGDEHLIEI